MNDPNKARTFTPDSRSSCIGSQSYWRVAAACLASAAVHLAFGLTPDPRPAKHGRIDTEWQIAPLSAHLDAGLMHELFARIADHTYRNIHSVLIVRDGKLIVERYFPGRDEAGTVRRFDQDTLQDVASVTKSVNGLLIGIAIDRRLIRNVDEKISKFFPEYADIFSDPAKKAIRLRDCLSMTAGLAWDESSRPYTDPRNDHVAMNAAPDPIRYALERPVAAAPGEKFDYNSGIAIMLGEVIHKVSGLRADKFAQRYLFGPLAIRNYVWLKYPNGTVQTGGGLWMRPRDMAKIGALCLNEGLCKGKRVVSRKWIRDSMTKHAPGRDYGYQWWLGAFSVGPRKLPAYGAQGRGGQYIIVFPDLHLVAVFTGWNTGALAEQPYQMLQRYILPAAVCVRP